jgi:hypothetical protein
MFLKWVVVWISVFAVLAGSQAIFNSRDVNEDPREFIRARVQRARQASKAKLEMSGRGNNLRHEQVLLNQAISYPIPQKHADKFLSYVDTSNDDCSGDPISGSHNPLNVCQGVLDESWSFMSSVRNQQQLLYY